MDLAESPPAAEKMLLFTQGEILSKLIYFSLTLLLAFDFALQRLNETGNRDDNGNPLPPDRVHEFCGPERIVEYNSASQHRGDEYSEHMPKYVTEGEQV